MTDVNTVIVQTEHGHVFNRTSQMRFENDTLIDKKESTTKTYPDGKETSVHYHYRKINETEYAIKTVMMNNETSSSETIQLTKLSDAGIKDFLDEWDRKWSTRTITDSEVEGLENLKIALEEAGKQARSMTCDTCFQEANNLTKGGNNSE